MEFGIHIRLAAAVLLCWLTVLSAGLCCAGASEDGQPWWPLQVKSYYGEFDPATKEPGHPAASLDRPRLEAWMPPARIRQSYTIGVSFPHLKDSYWVAVNYGIIDEARHLGLGVELVEAGGYGHLERQIEQVRHLADQGVDGIILGAISYTGNNELVAEMAARNIPVIEVINDISSQAVSAKALVSFYEMGYLTGEFVAAHAEERALETLSVAFFPGPRDSGWAPDTLDGFMAAMDHFPGRVDVAQVLWGDTGAVEQRRLIRHALASSGHVDYVVGNAVAADVAPQLLKELGKDDTAVAATYLIPSLYEKIQRGEVIGAPSDLTIFQGRMAVDMMARLLEGETPGKDFPFRSGPFIPMVTPHNIDSYPSEGLFGPRGYEPVFSLEAR